MVLSYDIRGLVWLLGRISTSWELWNTGRGYQVYEWTKGRGDLILFTCIILFEGQRRNHLSKSWGKTNGTVTMSKWICITKVVFYNRRIRNITWKTNGLFLQRVLFWDLIYNIDGGEWRIDFLIFNSIWI